MTPRRINKLHHRPSVRRLPGGLGVFRWVTSCPCGYFRPATFWHTALVQALLHAEELL